MLEPTIVYTLGLGTFLAVAVLSVLLILNCGLCNRGGEYEALLDKRPASTQPLVTKHQILTAAKKQWEKEDIVENVLYFVRSLPDCTLLHDHNLWTMSWRDTKANFLVEYKEKPNLLTIVRIGDSCPLPWNKSGKDALRTSLREMQHPFIQLCTESDILFEDKQVVTLTLFGNKGSLRDEIYSCEPTNGWDRKYNPKKAMKLSANTIAKYGKQILEALLFLEKSGFPYTHLHTGNVIVKNGVARITQLENGLLNLERQHERILRQFYKQSPKKFAENNLNLIAFGLVLYEMAVGKTLENLSQLAEYPSTSLPQVKTILDSIFSEGGEKAPTVEELLENPFFKSVTLANYQRPPPVVFNKQIQQVLKKANEATSQLFGVFKPAPKVKRTTRKVTSSATASPTATPRASTQPPSTTTPRTSTPASPAPTRPTTTTTTTPAKVTPPPAKAGGPAPPTGGPPPPTGGPPRAGGPPPPGPPPDLASAQPGRNNLLSSITSFKGGLKKVKTVDKSAPVAGKVLGT